ncbi:hypothetical protein ACEPPN_012756 [Leptodophora sp. 'Broadleaf-Isolate-01']
MNGLINSKHSLEEITLSSRGHHFRDRYTMKTWSPITSLKSYTKLRSLELESWMFFNATGFPLGNDYTALDWLSELLPDSLEQLSIRELTTSDLDKLRIVFTSARSVSKNLRMLKIVCRISAEDFENYNLGLWLALEEVTGIHGIVMTREMHMR